MAECATVSAFMTACRYMAYIGNIAGSLEYTANGTCYAKFEGIRYAQQLFPETRFMEPYPITTKENVRRRVDCMEVNPVDGVLIGEEDCLFLNVFAPLVTPNKSMPVMIWIHGRAFPLRSNRVSIYNPEPLMDHKMIVVTLAYRLGPLGFDHWREPVLDLGVRDQRLAIKWVLKNIHMFGGDPERITLAGESAGAVHALHHVNGYFKWKVHKAIALSGFRTSQWGYTHKRWTKNETQNLFKTLQCDDMDGMREKSAEEIVNSSYVYNTKNRWRWSNVFDEYRPPINRTELMEKPWVKEKQMGNHSLLIGLRVHEGDIIDESKYKTSEEDLGRYYCHYSNYSKRFEKKVNRHCDYFSARVLSSLYPDDDLSSSIKNFVEDGWALFPGSVDVRYHLGDFQGFMYEYRMCGASQNCTLQCKVPFMKIEDGCPSYRKEYEPVASQFKKVIADFVHGRNLKMKHFIDDNNFFNITSPLINPDSYSHYFISEDLAWRMKSWNKFYRLK